MKNSFLRPYFFNKFRFSNELHIIVFSNVTVTEVLQAHGRGRDLTQLLGAASQEKDFGTTEIRTKGEIKGEMISDRDNYET